MTSSRQKTVYVGLSGGVDSSVAAALLLDQGYHVVGVFIRTWQPDWLECTWKEDRRDAMRVCAKLGIQFRELDLSDVYKNEVADYMIAEYRAGRTPNPDVMCNREVKFGAFMRWALEEGADYVATGHYARAIHTGVQTDLARGKDASKDQSYFLWTLTSDQLSKILFPVGEFEKSKVRTIAAKKGLLTAEKKDSQGICFLGPVDMKEFLEHYIDVQPGKVLSESGEVIGRHDGALFFTLGERRGFTIIEKTDQDKPRYVVAKDVAANTITVSESIQPRPESRSLTLERVVVRKTQIAGASLIAQIRYHGQEKPCRILRHEGDRLEIEFEEYDPTIAAGQSIVLYDGEVCVGGGIVA